MHILIEHQRKYINRRVSEVDELRSSLLTENYEVALVIGHRLKGNGLTFGFPLISAVGVELEQAAIAKDKMLLNTAIKKLKLCVDEILIKLSK